MNTITHLFFGFEGRISRQQFWLGFVILAVANAAVDWLFGVPLFPDSPPDLHVRLLDCTIDVVFLYPTIALAAKRLHDRNQPARHAWWLVAAVAAGMVANLFGLFDDPSNASPVGWVVAAFVLVIVLGFLVELGFRRGTAGDNPFGPDPLATHP
jgi:uncharacterized membrane protein YhaH (DUF805 family)